MGKEKGGKNKEGNGILGDEEKYHIIKLFYATFAHSKANINGLLEDM